MTKYFCEDCGTPYPVTIATICFKCGGKFLNIDIQYNSSEVNENFPGIWKYFHTFGLPEKTPNLFLGEGNTPLVNVKNTSIYFKAEYQNPTGSYKDRLIAPIISLLSSFGSKEAVEDSSGNAGASFAAYIAMAGIKGKVFIPANASGPKRNQIINYGSEIVSIEGNRYETNIAINKYVKENNATYASHALIPHGIAGVATIAYEIFEELGDVPDIIVCPVGHGGLLAGIGLGFDALKNAGLIVKIPKIIGVQSKNFSPVFNLMYPEESNNLIETIAEGASVLNAVYGKWIVNNKNRFNLDIEVVDEEEIVNSRDELANMGFFVEETSAIIWPIIKRLIERQLNIVGILTGSGLKSSYIR